ncbi:unnamed protein product [Triticum turgidum subsp. durum]|uniref:Uncharacterized protein n=1 Tax=Triticum turgidum subsp. durum TaxID=4567 RepID=A0A9R0S6V7_TRITD|nr:unnamed protein product [Triticum turgidum subsp. durum]
MRLSHHTTLLPHATLQLHTAIGISPCSPHRTAVRHISFLPCLCRSNTGLATLDHLHYMQNLKQICRYKTSRLVLIFTLLILMSVFDADHPQLLVDAIVAPQTTALHLVVDDAITAVVTTTHHLIVVDGVIAPITTSSCRTRRPPLDVDDALATPIATSSFQNSFAPSKPLAASHRHRPPSGIAPPPTS